MILSTIHNGPPRHAASLVLSVTVLIACALPFIQAVPLQLPQEPLSGGHQVQHHVTHSNHHDHDHHDHDHDDHHHNETLADILDHKGHNCIHDKIDHPAILRNYMSRPEYIDQPDSSQRRFEYLDYSSQRRNDGRNWDGSSADTGSTEYNESVCTSTGAETKQSLRLTLKKSDISGLTTAYATYLENVLMPEVKSYFEATLEVAPLNGNLKVASNVGLVTAADGVTIEPNDLDPGFPDTDYLLYYSATDSPACTDKVLAYASAFEVTECDRPLVGYIHFCPNGLTTVDTSSTAHAQQLSTAKHEVTHALGFSSRLYPYYRNSDMSPRTPRNTDGVPSSATLTVQLSNTGNDNAGTATLFTPDTSYFAGAIDPLLGGERFKFKSANVLSKARQHFGCSSLDGIEVENQGGSGSWGSHWEKRIIGNEYMSAVANDVSSPVSAITLALFEDMGFWDVNYAKADDFPHMQNAGCDTVTKQCLTNGVSINSKYFCNADSSMKTCTFDGAAEAYCNKGTQSGLASHYYHFGDTSTAGNLMYADYCPTVTHYQNRICTDGSVVQGSQEKAMGAEFGSSSRCFSSSLYSTVYNPQEMTAGCYKYQCLSSSAMQISVYYSQTQSFTVDCTSATAGNVMQVPNFNGGLTCPNPADITVCGAETSYASLSGLRITSGSTDLNNQLVPAFSEFETNYRLNIGSAIDSLDLTPTTTSTSGVTIEYTVDGVTQAAPASGTTYSTPVQPQYNTLKFKMTRTISPTSSTVGQSTTREYTIGVTRGTGDSTTKTVRLTLNLDYASVSADMTSFRTRIANEIVSVLSLQNPAQVELYTVTEGSVVVLFTLLAGSTTDPDPYSIEATLQTLVNDKNSVLFDRAKYSYLSYASTFEASSDFVPCVDSSGAQMCSAENCNIETGSCLAPSESNDGGDSEIFPSWAIYAAAGLGALTVCMVIYCLAKHFCRCCASKESSSTSGTKAATKKVYFSDSTDFKKSAVELEKQPQTVTIGVKTAQKSKFSDMIHKHDSDSSDDEGPASTSDGRNIAQL